VTGYIPTDQPTFAELRAELEALIGAEATAQFSKSLDWNDVSIGASERLRAAYRKRIEEATHGSDPLPASPK
jgi:hypothetical protein